MIPLVYNNIPMTTFEIGVAIGRKVEAGDLEEYTMASIVYRTNKETGVVYAYRSESYRDPQTKQPRNRRTYLGRVDPETQKIVPKAEPGKRNRSKLGTAVIEEGKIMSPEISDVIDRQRNEIVRLNQVISELRAQYQQMKQSFASIRDSMNQLIDL